MTGSLPWGRSSIDDWMTDLIEICVQENVHEIKESVKGLLLSKEDNDSLQFPLFELLGDDSFEAIEAFLNYRQQIVEALTAPPPAPKQEQEAKKPKVDADRGKITPLSGGQRFNQTETMNATRYDVAATTLQRPNVKRVPISALPEWARGCFPGCQNFNDIQSLVFEQAFNNNQNLLISAPTGAGKTNVALLTILHELAQHMVTTGGTTHLSPEPFLIVYITPMKALATEITEKFKMALRHLKVVVREYTGDTRISAMELEKSHILVATPEKWDVATRRGGEDAPGMRLRLLIIDEIHLLQDDRGPVLEALVARTLRLVEQTQSMIRIVGLSATLPNCHDVGRFLRTGDEGLFIFGPEFRPVPLAMTLIGAKNTTACKAEYEEILAQAASMHKDKDTAQIDVIAIECLKEAIRDGKQVLVFVHTRGETARFANMAARYMDLRVSRELAHMMGKRRLTPQLGECLQKGVGIHHAGLPRQDRLFVEDAFRANSFPILVCTATLAWGVNLPAHTVIIKDTKVYNNEHGGFEDIGILDVLQMFGRAGRPQFDTDGHAILISTSKVLSKYTTTLVKAQPIESKLAEKLEDFLNAEISLGTVTCKRDALIWIKYTFMYQRKPMDDVQLSRLDAATYLLNENHMIRTSLSSEALQPTHLGQVASIHYIPFQAVQHFNENLHGGMSESELLDCVFSSGIFQSLIVRSNELQELQDFEPLIPLLTPPDELAGKANVLFQAYLSHHVFRTPSLQLDQMWIADNMQRVFDAIFELAIERGWCFVAEFSLNLCKMVENQMWWCSKRHDHPLRQVLNYQKYMTLFKKLDRTGLGLNELREGDFNEIKAMLREGQLTLDAIKAAKQFPCVNIHASYQPMSDSIVKINVEASFPFQWTSYVAKEIERFWLFVEDRDGGQMYHAQEVSCDKRTGKTGLTFEVLVPLSSRCAYNVSLVSTRLLGFDDVYTIVITGADRNSFERFESRPPQLRPLPVDSIGDPEIEKLFPFSHFNLIQSQIFFQTFRTNDSLLVCAPTAAGKTVIAELAISKMLKESDVFKAVYLVPLKAIVQERVADWKRKFGSMLIELTGDFTPDSNAIAKARIIVATPEKWDAVSRGFVVRKFVQCVTVMILDEVHLLGTDRGHIIEAVVDRMRAMPYGLRIIGLSTCLSNPLDVAQFLKVPKRGCYNFPPSMRTVPLMTFIRGFPGRHYCPRMAAMNKPLSDAILDNSKGKPTLVFVSSRKQTRLTAMDLIAYANMSGHGTPYSTPEATAAANEVYDQDLSHCLAFGVGIHHAGLLPHDLQIVENLFASGTLRLLVATATLAWGVNLPAHFVVIKGTEYFDPKTCQYVQYTVTELQQMMGRAGRPQFDKEGKVMILCEESRKEFIKKFINSPFPVESSMMPHVADHVNAEIASGRIRSKNALMAWIDGTYFALRLAKNPKYYGEKVTVASVAEETLKELTESTCCTVNIDGHINPTPAGKIGSIFYVSHKTVRHFLKELWNVKSIVDVLRLICDAEEFNEVPVRHNEDDTVSRMTPRFSTPEDQPDSPHIKAFYLIQYYLSHRKMPTPDFETDCSSVLDQALRVVGCFGELCAAEKCLFGMIYAIELGQMLVQGIWHDEVPLKALMNEKSLVNLKKQDIKTLPQLLLMKDIPSELRDVCSRILLYEVTAREVSDDKCRLRVQIKRINGVIGSNVASPHYLRKEIQSMYIIIGSPSSEKTIAHRRVQLRSDEMTITLESHEPFSDNCWVYFMSDAYVGIDQMYSITDTKELPRLRLVEKKRKEPKPRQQRPYREPPVRSTEPPVQTEAPPPPPPQPQTIVKEWTPEREPSVSTPLVIVRKGEQAPPPALSTEPEPDAVASRGRGRGGRGRGRGDRPDSEGDNSQGNRGGRGRGRGRGRGGHNDSEDAEGDRGRGKRGRRGGRGGRGGSNPFVYVSGD